MTASRRLLASGLTLALSAGLLVASAGTATAEAITVNSLTDTTGDDGSCTLREAIIAANTETASGAATGECAAGSGNDTISFTVTGTIPIGGELTVTDVDGLRIQGPGMNLLTLDGGGADRIFVSNGPLLLVALTVTGGDSVSDGGGIANHSTLTITNSTVSANTASGAGGGIFNAGGILTVTGSTVSGNAAGGDGGGGIFNDDGTLTITNSTVSTNTSTSDGGGIKNDFSGSVTITGSTVSGNTASVVDGIGGGIDNDGTLTITSSAVSGNTAGGDGGGIYNNLDDDAVLEVTSSTFSGNTAGGSGGAICNRGFSDPLLGGTTLLSTNVQGNTAGTGGGIFTDAGTLTITNSRVSGNSASGEGGGILNDGFPNESTLILTTSTVSGNSAGGDGGGGIYNEAGTLTITNSTVSTNTSTIDGGGIKNDGGTVTITGSTVSGNTASVVDGIGGGIDNDGTVTITNSTFSGNTAGGDGGAIYNNLDDDAVLEVTSSTLSGNSAGGDGGAIFSVPSGPTTGGVTLRSTIVANSPSGGDCAGAIVDGGYNLSSDASCGFGGTSQSGVNPLLQPLANNGGPTRTMALPESSPAANVIPEGQPPGAGCGTTIDTDQRGFVRPEDDLCEIGAYEIQDQAPQPPPVVAPPDALSMSPTSGPVGTIVTITGSNLANALVRFNGIAAPVLTNTPTQVVAAVPPHATTGPVSVHTSGGADGAGTFTVTTTPPSISGFSPGKGQVGTSVVITGSGFTGTAVSFGGVEADFVVDSPSQITAVVPPGAGTGQVQVTTAQGTASSAGAFVVTHARNAGLHQSQARGSLSVPDGWSACSVHVSVRLQRWEGGRFVTVGSDTTNGAGSFRFGAIDGSGRYRAVAKRLTLASGDVCLKVRSPVVTW